MSLYSELIAAAVPVSNWQSDLYFKNTPGAREILKKFPNVHAISFHNNEDGTLWIEAAFQFDPYWEARK